MSDLTNQQMKIRFVLTGRNKIRERHSNSDDTAYMLRASGYCLL